MADSSEKLDVAAAEELERRYDSGLALRATGPLLSRVLFVLAIAYALYHYLTAGFGLPVDFWHMGLHLAGLFILIFTGFP
ncbi:MAG: TRAP transporter permease, partial [Kiloniellales bacterium]|nr:TRAP transporter permease [Kiloniellales bacterium]